MEVASSSSSSTASESLLKPLISRGWCFNDFDQIKDLIIMPHLSSSGNSFSVDSIESELLNCDLRSIGGKSLPEPTRFRQVSQIQGPKVLQIASVRDISRSSMGDSVGNSNKRRLLRLKLTDGQSEITAIEYSHIPSIPDDIAPGTKVRLENKAKVNSGILCLNAKVITVLGGLVQSLYEEWEMNQKLSGFARPSMRSSIETGASCPPPFEKFQVGSSQQQQSRSFRNERFSSSSTVPAPAGIGESSTSRKESEFESVLPPASVEDKKERPTNSDARPKEVSEAVPIQNQAASQKLLQKMVHSTRGDHSSRGRRHRRSEKEEVSQVLTLDEWERSQTGIKTSVTHDFPDVSQDAELARELQEKFDLEDIQVQKSPYISEADNIRMSMFNFERDDSNPGRSGSRGRGRGRGRRGGRGRGRN